MKHEVLMKVKEEMKSGKLNRVEPLELIEMIASKMLDCSESLLVIGVYHIEFDRSRNQIDIFDATDDDRMIRIVKHEIGKDEIGDSEKQKLKKIKLLIDEVISTVKVKPIPYFGPLKLDEFYCLKEIKNKLNSIFSVIEQLHAYENNKSNNHEDSFNNAISIFGARGAGKSSLLLTLKEKIKNKYCNDIILDTIDPDRFQAEDDVLGWIIQLLGKHVEDLGRNMFGNKLSKELSFSPICKNDFDNLKKEHVELEEMYVMSNVFFKDKFSKMAMSKQELSKNIKSSIKSNIDFYDYFHKFINTLIGFIKKYTVSENVLIHISFDDADLEPKHCVNILKRINQYLNHKNILVYFLGDKNQVIRNMLIIDGKVEIATKLSQIKSEFYEDYYEKETNSVNDYLDKVLPIPYRFELKGPSKSDILEFNVGFKKEQTVREVLKNFTFKALKFVRNKNDEYHYECVLDSNLYSMFFEHSVKVQQNLVDLFDLENDTIVERKIESEYINALPNTPRKLVSFYYGLNEFENFVIDKKNSYTNNQLLDYNFDKIFKFYKLLNSSQESVIKEIIFFNRRTKSVVINFNNITIDSTKITSGRHIVNQNINFVKKGGKGKIEDRATLIIQLLYDMCLSIIPGRTHILMDMTLENIVVYENSYWNIKFINPTYFISFYLYQSLIELAQPYLNAGENFKKLEIFQVYNAEVISAINLYLKKDILNSSKTEKKYGNENLKMFNDEIKINKIELSKIQKSIGYKYKKTDENLLVKYKKLAENQSDEDLNSLDLNVLNMYSIQYKYYKDSKHFTYTEKINKGKIDNIEKFSITNLSYINTDNLLESINDLNFTNYKEEISASLYYKACHCLQQIKNKRDILSVDDEKTVEGVRKGYMSDNKRKLIVNSIQRVDLTGKGKDEFLFKKFGNFKDDKNKEAKNEFVDIKKYLLNYERLSLIIITLYRNYFDNNSELIEISVGAHDLYPENVFVCSAVEKLLYNKLSVKDIFYKLLADENLL